MSEIRRGRPKAKEGKLIPVTTNFTEDHRALLEEMSLVRQMQGNKGLRLLLEEMTRQYIQHNPDMVDKLKALATISGRPEDRIDKLIASLFGGTLPAAPPAPAPKVKATRKVPAEVIVPKPAAKVVLTPVQDNEPAPFESLENPPVGKVWAVQYEGRSGTWHLAEAGAQYGAACGLRGRVDKSTLQLLDPAEINCGKCRYSRKAVFQ